MKRKCVECKYYSLINRRIPHKTGYCKWGNKTVRFWDNKSIACNNFVEMNQKVVKMADKERRENLAKTDFCRIFLHVHGFLTDKENEKVFQRLKKMAG